MLKSILYFENVRKKIYIYILSELLNSCTEKLKAKKLTYNSQMDTKTNPPNLSNLRSRNSPNFQLTRYF